MHTRWGSPAASTGSERRFQRNPTYILFIWNVHVVHYNYTSPMIYSGLVRTECLRIHLTLSCVGSCSCHCTAATLPSGLSLRRDNIVYCIMPFVLCRSENAHSYDVWLRNQRFPIRYLNCPSSYIKKKCVCD